MVSLLFNHWIGRIIFHSKNKAALAIGVTGNLAALAWFKYAGFVFAQFGGPEIQPHLPLGISFYTFQAISFLIDLYRRDAPAPRNVIDTSLYISMFPQLIAGPIVRYKTVAEQIKKRSHNVGKFSSGAHQFILGLAQKTPAR